MHLARCSQTGGIAAPQAEMQLLRLKYSRAEIRVILPVRQYLSEGNPVAMLAGLSLLGG